MKITKKKIARIISDTFNGFATMFLPIMLTAYLSDIKLEYKIGITIYYLLASLIPFSILKAMKKVSDYEFTDRKERPPYFISISILFLIGYLLVLPLNNTAISAVALALVVITTILTLVTFIWKMSGHMTYGVYFLMTMLFLFPNIPYLWLILLFIPPLAWSRVELEKHTYPQTIVGTIVPLLTTILFYHILW